jgi:hypothetical protein
MSIVFALSLLIFERRKNEEEFWYAGLWRNLALRYVVDARNSLAPFDAPAVWAQPLQQHVSQSQPLQ